MFTGDQNFVFLVVLTQEMQCSCGLVDADNNKEGLRSVALVALVLHQHQPLWSTSCVLSSELISVKWQKIEQAELGCGWWADKGS